MTSKVLVPYVKNEINNDVDEFSKGLETYLTTLGLPCENVLVEIKERKIVIANMPSIVESLQEDKLDEAYYISKFIASCGVGLFDAALNYLWNETIVNLRQKIIYFDLEYFFNLLGKESYHTEKNLKKIEDWELIRGCHEAEIISDIGFKHLDYIRDMRNFASAAHPNNTELDGLQILSWLQTCIKEVLSKEPSAHALVIKRLLPSIREETFTESDARPIIRSIEQLPQDLANSLLIALFGMYTDDQVESIVQNNIKFLAKTVWLRSDDKTRNNIGLKYSTFSAHAQITRKELAKDFLNLVNGLGYLTDDQRSIEMGECLKALQTAHNGHNNYYNEEPHAKILSLYVRNNPSIPNNIRFFYVKVIITCKLGNWYGYSYVANNYYTEMIKRFGDEEIKEFLSLLRDREFRSAFGDPKRAIRFKKIAKYLANNTPNALLTQALEKVIESSNIRLGNGRAYSNVKDLIN